jgi:hypothetical protein
MSAINSADWPGALARIRRIRISTSVLAGAARSVGQSRFHGVM